MRVFELGDVHLGKRFEMGVPLHRRGDREVMQWTQFERELDQDCDLHIQMGDIFDKFVVPYTVILRAANAYRQARTRHPNRVYALIRGNHDASKDADKVSAFQVFTELVRPHGIVVADEEPVLIDEHVLIPWHPFKSATEMVEEHADLIREAKIAYGHWDVVMGQENQLPAAQLKALGIEQAVTGHDHNARTIELAGLPVRVTGSMQPYSHAEDPSGELYVTMTLLELKTTKLDLRNRCVRVVLEPGEEVDEPVDCLQFTTVRNREDGQEEGFGQVEFEEFDFDDLWAQAMSRAGVASDFIEKARAKLEEERAARS